MSTVDQEDGWGFGIHRRFEDAYDDIAKAVEQIIRPRTHGTPATVEEEAVFNENNMLSTYFLIRGAEVARFVGKLRLSSDVQGTGFMVSERLLMTNWHVFNPVMKNNDNKRVASSLAYNDATVTFGDVEAFRLCSVPETLKEAEFALLPDVFYYEYKELDLGVVAVAETSIDGKGRLSDYGHCQAVRSGVENLTTGDHINIIQHPKGKPQKLVLRENQIVHSDDEEPYLKFFEKSYMQEISIIHARVEGRVTRKTAPGKATVDEVDVAGIGQSCQVLSNITYKYRTDTDKGSSGAPCFDDEWKLVCLHHAAVLTEAEGKRRRQGTCRSWCRQNLLCCVGHGNGRPITTDQQYSANEGIKIGHIIDHLEQNIFPDPQYKYKAEVLGELFGKP